MIPAAKLSTTLLALVTVAVASNSHSFAQRRHAGNVAAKRAATDSAFQSLWYQSNYQDQAQPPEYQDGDTGGQVVIINSANGTDNNSNVQTCPIAFIGGSAVEGSEDGGWQSKAQVVGFDTMSLDLGDDLTMPYYIERKDYTKVKRIVMVMQGKPRDAWRYPNLLRYSGKCAVANSDWSTNDEDFIVAAPIIFNTDDVKAGGAAATDLVWKGGQWAKGTTSSGPGDADWTVFKALDSMVDHFFNTSTFPNLNSVSIAGHSAGAILAQHYAMVRKSTSGQDENMRWFISNAGSYVWPVDSRPVMNPSAEPDCKSSNSTTCEMTPSCNVTMTQWPYGLNMTDSKTMSSYARQRMEDNKDEVVQDYFNRRVQYTFSELDDGAGDTHCEAQFQGDTHLSRGQNLVKALQDAGATGMHMTIVPNATHVDEEVYIDPATQQWLFVTGMDDTRNGTSKKSGSSSSSSSKSSSGGKSSSSGSGSSSAAMAMPAAPAAAAVLFAVSAVALGAATVL
ncbi:unnamed protein product [Jaminaea pallidilutea]